jgi:hypothetical protein
MNVSTSHALNPAAGNAAASTLTPIQPCVEYTSAERPLPAAPPMN